MSQSTTQNSDFPQEVAAQSAALPPELDAPDAIAQLATVLMGSIELKKFQFHISDNDLTPSQVTQPEGVLPLILLEVEKMHQQAFGATAGLRFVADGSAMFGARVVDESGKRQRAALTLFALEVLVNVHERLEGNLDHLRDNFFADYEAGHLPWSQRTPSRSLNMSWAGQSL